MAPFMQVKGMSNYAILKKAIQQKQQVQAVFKGLTRWLCPHVLGNKNGKKHCLFYQFGGQSSRPLEATGSFENWRCLPVSELQIVAVKKGRWHTAPNFFINPQSCVDEVDIQVII